MLLTGRQLIAEMSRLGLKAWDSSAPRRWISEDPPCPIAEHADRGQPHRYRLLDVLKWLLEREQRAKAKGYTSGSGTALADRIETALRHFVAGTLPSPSGAAEAAAAETLPLELPVQSVAPEEPAPFEQLTDVESLLDVIKGRNPSLWNAAEEALRKRRLRLEAEGKLVPVEEVEEMLSTQALAMRSACQALVVAMAQRIPDMSGFEQRRILLQSAVDDMLNSLARDQAEEIDDSESLAEAT